ncbi:MAG: hypothetical protein V3V99_08560 [candidate division Zixibacteria bacterium]
MCNSKSNALIAMSGFIVLACVLLAGSLYAEPMTKVAGKMTMEIVKADTLAVADTEGHHMFLQVYEGTNAKTGDNEFMAGATLRNTSFSDIVQGNGFHQGYVEFTKDDGTTIAKWKGKITTTLAADGTKVTSFEGSFSYISGTGKFENIQGSGTYTGQFTSNTTLTADWEGEITLGE